MRFAVESWAPDYGAPVDPEQLEPADGSVNTGVELPAAAWRPLEPATPEPVGRILFVDGVRRIDARVWITGEGGTAHAGVAASYAAGVVCCEPRAEGASGRAARIDRCEVVRALFSAAPDLAGIDTRHGAYRPCAVAGDSADALSLALQQRMGELEAAVAAGTGVADADLVVVDGPLNKLPSVPNAVGYVKTHHRRYLGEDLTAVVAALRPGERTPLFVTAAQWSRYSWYARLPATAGPGAHPWSGVVRGEASGELATAEAGRLADLATAALPAYASSAHKDPRAPQNLVPIAELERGLRRHLGDPALLYRSLRLAAARQFGIAIPADIV